MSGRRSHARFTVNPAVKGMVRVLRDVTVHQNGGGEFVVISREPGVVAEQMALEMSDPQAGPVRVEVTESRPLIVDGAVRHRLRLRVLADAADAPLETAEDVAQSPSQGART